MNRNTTTAVVAPDCGLQIDDCRLGVEGRRKPARATASIVNRQSSIRNGFTLIELLLVLVILATLAAIVVPRLAGKGQQAKIGAAGADISNLSTALNNFEIDCSRFPTTEEGLNALMTQPSSLNGWKGPYLEKGVPPDPWLNKYIYRCPGQHPNVSFDLFSCGPSGQEGGPDNIDNWTIKGAENK